MTDYSQSSHFRELFEHALQDYENQTGTTLARHPLAEQLQCCNSVDSVLAILQQQAQAFAEFRGSDGRITKSLKSAVSAIHVLSSSTTLTDILSMSFPPAQAIFSGIAVLFAAVKDVGASYDTLVDLLESIERFLCRLDIYTKISPTVAMAEIIIKILVELLSTLALATKQIKQKRSMKLVKKLFGDNEVEAVLQRLDRLTQDEARTTAAQTLEVVYGLMQNMKAFMDDGKLSIDIRAALETMQQVASNMNKSKRDKLQHDVRKWLSPPDPWKNHNLACALHHEGTAMWFLQGDTFSQWKASAPSPLLWIHGKPGAGKSIICSTIIEDIITMRKSGLASLAFFYCDFREEEKKDLRGLLSSLLVQLCHQSDSYCAILSKFRSEHENGSQQPKDDALIQCLKELLKFPGQAPIYLVLDALDECPDTSARPSPRERVLMLVEELVNTNLPNIRICVTSRPEMDIKMALDPLTFHSVSLHDEGGQITDIENYIKSAISGDPKNRRWKTKDKQMVIDVLTRNANGMFRWVYCQEVYLRGCHPGCIRQALAELPESLDETYRRTLREIHNADWEFAHRLFQCIAVASRPLSVKELAEFLAFDFKAGQIPKFQEDWRSEDPLDAVLSTCSSLLSVVDVESSPVIQFCHFSVKEFLVSTRLAETSDNLSRRYHISLTSAHTVVAQACLGILLHLDASITEDGLQKFPLSEYAAEHWVDHARFENISANVEEGMKRLFDPSKPHLGIYLRVYNPEWSRYALEPREGRLLAPRETALYYAALWGFERIVEFLVITHSQDVNSRASDGSTALHVASVWGHTEVIRILLGRGADPTAQNDYGQTPFHSASEFGHVEIIRILLEQGADPTARTNTGRAPFHLASWGGYVEVIRILLEQGADPISQDVAGWTPFHFASESGSVELIRILLEQGADPTAQAKDGQTPFHRASSYGHVEVIRILLEQGADPIAQSNDGWTPFHFASEGGHVEVIRILLEQGADPTAQDNDGQTPFHYASQGGHAGVFRILLEQGADPTARANDGRTPFHFASEGGHVEVIRILLEQGADPTAQDNDGRTPFHFASELGHVEVIRILLEQGADPTARANDGRTPFHFASERGHVEVIRILLEQGADPAAQDNDGQTPFHLASGGGHVEVIRILLEQGADPTAQDNDGPAPSKNVSARGHHHTVQSLS